VRALYVGADVKAETKHWKGVDKEDGNVETLVAGECVNFAVCVKCTLTNTGGGLEGRDQVKGSFISMLCCCESLAGDIQLLMTQQSTNSVSKTAANMNNFVILHKIGEGEDDQEDCE
jgi:hypothetical protein